jgi:hypothetical protein
MHVNQITINYTTVEIVGLYIIEKNKIFLLQNRTTCICLASEKQKFNFIRYLEFLSKLGIACFQGHDDLFLQGIIEFQLKTSAFFYSIN